MINIIITIYIVITMFLDYFFSNILDYSYNNLSYFFPMLMVVALIIIYSLLKNKTNIFIISLILGIIYDLMYLNFYPFNTLIFFILGVIVNKVNNFNSISICIKSLLFIFIYDSIIFFSLVISKYSNNTIYDLFYKFSHSILLNIIYVIISYTIFHKLFIKKNANKDEYSLF